MKLINIIERSRAPLKINDNEWNLYAWKYKIQQMQSYNIIQDETQSKCRDARKEAKTLPLIKSLTSLYTLDQLGTNVVAIVSCFKTQDAIP